MDSITVITFSITQFFLSVLPIFAFLLLVGLSVRLIQKAF